MRLLWALRSAVFVLWLAATVVHNSLGAFADHLLRRGHADDSMVGELM